MRKSKIRIIEAWIILLMLGASPISITYSFAENESNKIENEEFKTILTEKVVDGKLQVRQYTLPEDFSETDLKRMLSFEGQISWAYVNYKMYQSGIVLFDGKVSKIGENLWEISVENNSNEELSYKIVFSGKNPKTEEENGFAISFMNNIIKNLETAQNSRLMQSEESFINPEKSVSYNQEFKNSILMR